MAVKAFILAAGRGTRLEEITQDKPKCLAKVGGASLLDRQVATLKAAGVSDIILVTGYRADMLALPGTTQIHNPQWVDTNMVESLFCAESHFGDDFIVSYSDILYEPRLVHALLKSDHDVSVLVNRQWRRLWQLRFKDPLEDAESLRLDANDQITDIGNKVETIDEIQGQFMGLMRFRGCGVEALRRTYDGLGHTPRPWQETRPVRKAYMTDLLMELILAGHAVHAVPVDGGWLEIDTIEDYRLMERLFADGSIGRFIDPRAFEITS